MKRFTRVLALLVATATLIGTQLAPVQAAQTSSGLSIAPRKNYTINPGDTIQDKLQVSNLNRSQPLQLNVRMVDFTFTDETGTPKLNLDPNANPTTWSLKPFAALPSQTITADAGETTSINYSIKIPKNQGAGSYYSAIVYSTGGPEGGQVNLNASGVTLVFVSVPGTVKQDLTLEKLGAYQSNEGVSGGGFTFINIKQPKEIGFTLKNKGNVAESPTGSITLHRTFSNQDIQIDNVNPNGSLALRGQTRLFTSCIESEEVESKINSTSNKVTQCANSKLWPGHYSVRLNLVYGQNGNLTKEIAGSASFWYIPIWFMLAVVGVIVLIVYAVWRTRRKIQTATKGRPYQKRSRRR